MDYQGNELRLFKNARTWKNYFSKQILPFVSGDVLEVGAGIGGNTKLLKNSKVKSWTALEPDLNFCNELKDKFKDVNIINGTIDSIGNKYYDTILYIDVLEHIEEDHIEFNKAVERLKKDGHLIILCPAHDFLFSPFDHSVGHFRRYNKKMFHSFKNDRTNLQSIKYLDSFGLSLSLINSKLLKSSMPTKKQIQFWDKVIVPISKIFDPILNYSQGKSILGVWEKN